MLERSINVLDGNTIEIAHLPLYLRDQETVSIPNKESDSIEKQSANAAAMPTSSGFKRNTCTRGKTSNLKCFIRSQRE